MATFKKCYQWIQNPKNRRYAKHYVSNINGKEYTNYGVVMDFEKNEHFFTEHFRQNLYTLTLTPNPNPNPLIQLLLGKIQVSCSNIDNFFASWSYRTKLSGKLPNNIFFLYSKFQIDILKIDDVIAIFWRYVFPTFAPPQKRPQNLLIFAHNFISPQAITLKL